jgi:hypothetical protein
MVSDHGASVVETHLDLATWFRHQGVATLSHPVLWERNPRAAVMVAGNGSAMVYARPGEPRRERWSLARLRGRESFGTNHDLIETLLTERGVGFVAAEERSGVVRVAGAEGVAEIREEGERIHYMRLSGDPLLLGADLIHSAAEWVEAAWDSSYPDACYQLLDQFRAPRTGDLIVVAKEGTDFRLRFEVPEHKAGHGSLIRAHMQVPVWSSVEGPATPLRTVDLFPAMLDWLGVPVPQDIDGQPVWTPSPVMAVA